MNNKNTNFLLDSYNEKFNNFFNDYYLTIRKRANQLALENTVEPENEVESNSKMREMYYSHFFKDIVGWCKLFNFCSVDPPKKNKYYTISDVSSFFTIDLIKGHKTEVEDIIFNVFANYVDLAFKFTAPLWNMIDSQDNLIKSFINVIEEKNNEGLQYTKNQSFRFFTKYCSLNKVKLSEIKDDEFIMVSIYIKNKLKSTKGKCNQGDFENEMEILFDSAKRGNVRTQVEKRFSPNKYPEWLKNL